MSKIFIMGDTSASIFSYKLPGLPHEEGVHYEAGKLVTDLAVLSGAGCIGKIFNEKFSPDVDVQVLLASSKASRRGHLLRYLIDYQGDEKTDKVLRLSEKTPILETYKIPDILDQRFYGKAQENNAKKTPRDTRIIKQRIVDLQEQIDSLDRNSLLVIAHGFDHIALEDQLTSEPAVKHESNKLLEKFIKIKNQHEKDDHIKIMISVNNTIPEYTEENKFASESWQRIADHFSDNTCVVVSGTTLRHAGAMISRRLSWEQTISDLINELETFPAMKALTHFKHIVVRFGMSGIVHLEKRQPEDHHGKWQGRFIFAPNVKDGIFRDKESEGDVIGKNVFVIAHLAYQLQNKDATGIDTDSLKLSLLDIIKFYKRGYMDKLFHGRFKHHQENDCVNKLTGLFMKEIAGHIQFREFDPKEEPFISDIEIPTPVMTNTNQEDWRISIQQFDGDKYNQNLEYRSEKIEVDSGRYRLNTAIAMVRYGREQVINCDRKNLNPEVQNILDTCNCQPDHYAEYDWMTTTLPADRETLPHNACNSKQSNIKPIVTPILKFGKFLTIERKEMEAIRSIRNIVDNYVHQCKKNSNLKPISLAVFGSPGSGKSFAVEELANAVNDSLAIQSSGIKLRQMNFNVSQFDDLSDLTQALTQISGANHEGALPYVFFDEFDCDNLKWLKYFLAPMQDGTFFSGNQNIKFGRAIFVFAGGVSHCYKDFDKQASWDLQTKVSHKSKHTDHEAAEFIKVKGPDFVSRLKGHFDVLPIDSQPNTAKHLLRRAITLRGLIEKHQLTKQQFYQLGKMNDSGNPDPELRELEQARDITELSSFKVANIQLDLLFAMLTINRYRHGVRSMEAILLMCSRLNGRIENSSLPSREQLGMHVNAEEFMQRVRRGRYRRLYGNNRAE